MKLYNMYYICKENYEGLCNLKYALSGQQYVFENWEAYKETLLKLREVPVLKNLVDSAYKAIPAFVSGDVRPVTNNSVYNSFMTKHKELVMKVKTIIDLYDSLELECGEEGIDIKLPPTTSFEEYVDNLQKLKFVFTKCPYLLNEEATLRFGSVDVGSSWITLLYTGAGATAILGMVALITQKALVLSSHFITIKKQAEDLRAYRLKNKAAESVVDIFEEMKKASISRVLDEIEAEKDIKLKNGEERGMAEQSLEKLGDLISKGLEIYASLDCNEEIKPLFPPLGSKEYLSDNVVKYLTEKDKEE